MSGNSLDQGIRANEAATRDIQESPADAKSSDAMLFRQYLTGGNRTSDAAMRTSSASSSSVSSSSRGSGDEGSSDMMQFRLWQFENRVRIFIDSGQAEFPSSASAEDRYNAFMFSDTIRYNFETETVQVLAESHVGGPGWQNLSDVSPELAQGAQGEIITSMIHRLQITETLQANFSSPEVASAGAIFADTQASTTGQQSDSVGTASVTVNTQAPLGSGVGSGVSSQDGSTQSEPELKPNTILSLGNGENVSSTVFTDDDGNLMSADINLETGNAVISDEAGNIVMAGTVNTVTGETNFTDANGEVVSAEDSPIGTEQLPAQVDENGHPHSILAITVVDQNVNFVQNPVDGAVGQNFYDHDGEQIPESPLPTMPDGSTPRPGGTPLPPEITIPEGAITVSTDGSDSSGTPVNAVVNPENQTIESSGVDANGNEIVVVSHPSSGVSMIIDPNTGDTLAYVHVDPLSGQQTSIDANGQPLEDYSHLQTFEPSADVAVTIDGHPASAIQVRLADGTLLYQAYILDDIGQNASMYVTGPDGKPMLAGVHAPYAEYVPVVPSTELAPPPDNSQGNQGTEDSNETPPLNMTTDAAHENQQVDLPVDFSTDAAWEQVNQQTGQGTTETTQTQTQTGGSGSGSGASPASAATPETPTTGNTLLSH